MQTVTRLGTLFSRQYTFSCFLITCIYFTSSGTSALVTTVVIKSFTQDCHLLFCSGHYLIYIYCVLNLQHICFFVFLLTNHCIKRFSKMYPLRYYLFQTCWACNVRTLSPIDGLYYSVPFCTSIFIL